MGYVACGFGLDRGLRKLCHGYAFDCALFALHDMHDMMRGHGRFALLAFLDDI
jgi:hypothetical protein